MISSEADQVVENVKRKNEGGLNLKYKKDGTLDMRYSKNVKMFREEYKSMLLLENRKHNNICHEINKEYRNDILNLSEEQLVKYF